MMRKIKFITGNTNKFAEAKLIIPELEHMDIDLPEIQELDAKKIVEAKLHNQTSAVAEDVSLEIETLGGLPGPLVKWFEKAIGAEGIFRIAPGSKARAIAVLGYKEHERIKFFEGIIEGTIVAPRGSNGFGFDVIFQPLGSAKTFGEMSREEKSRHSHRAKAFEKLKEYLLQSVR